MGAIETTIGLDDPEAFEGPLTEPNAPARSPRSRPTPYEAKSLPAKVRQVLKQMECLSQVSAAQIGQHARSPEHPGGKRPPGGLDGGGDRKYHEDHTVISLAFKSVDHYKRRIDRAKTVADIEAVLGDAQTTLAAWREPRRWTRGEMEPEWGSLSWKRMIADSPGTAKDLARRFDVSAKTVARYRSLYGRDL